MSRLEKDGLVYKKSGKILAVSRMTKEDSYHLYEARSALEGFAASLAVINITPKQLEELENLTKQYAAIGNGKSEDLNTNDYAEVDHKFHSLIIAASCNPYILRMYKSLEGYLLHYRYCLLSSLGPEKLQHILYQAAKRHQAIYNAFLMGFTDIVKQEVEQDVHSMLNAFSQWS